MVHCAHRLLSKLARIFLSAIHARLALRGNGRPAGLKIFRGHCPNLGVGFMKHWEIIADNLSKAGWSWGYVSALDAHGRTIWIANAHQGDGKRFVVRVDEKLTAFLELESANRCSSESS
jgi:hypothetical protein